MVEASPLIGRTSRVSAAAFTGRATAPAQPDPVTTGLISKNSLQLAVVSNQIQGMTAQMNSLAGSLQVISSNLATSQSLDRQREAQEQALQSKLAQEKLREGKESVIEKKIQTAAIAPAQKISSTAQFTLTRLNSFFMSLLGGWLLVKGVETLKALGDDNKDKLNEIKNSVIGTLTLIAGSYIGVRFGLRALSANFFRIGSRLLAVAAAGLFVNPAKQLIDYVVSAGKNLVEQIADPVKNLLGGEPEPDPSKTPEEQTNNPETTGMGGPSLASPTETMMGEKVNPKLEELQGELGGVKQDYMLNRISKEEYQEEKERLTSEIEALKSEKTKAQVTAQPQETMMGKPSESKEGAEVDTSKPPEYGTTTLAATDGESVEGDPSKGTKDTQLKEGSKSLVEMGFTTSEVDSFVDSEKYIGKTGVLTPDMLTPTKKDADLAQKVGPAPEPAVNVVPIQTSDETSKAPQQKPAATGSINNVPFFATSNSDNIYTLGAYSNFNVLPV